MSKNAQPNGRAKKRTNYVQYLAQREVHRGRVEDRRERLLAKLGTLPVGIPDGWGGIADAAKLIQERRSEASRKAAATRKAQAEA